MGVAQFFSSICGSCCGGMHLAHASHCPARLTRVCTGRSKDSIYDPVLADSEREAVADLLGFLENVPRPAIAVPHHCTDLAQRAETDFFTGEPLRALSTLVYSDNIDLQRSASLTFAEITERGTWPCLLATEPS